MKNIDIIDIFQHLLSGIENEIVEFKEAKNDFDSSKLGKYFSAISNEANLKQKEYGWLIFGVEDKKHQIVGTQYRSTPKSLESVKGEISRKTKEE
jgi:putative transcriptional regulator